jgi:hypothetical protein
MLRAKERTPTPFPSIVFFIFGFAMSSSKSLVVRHHQTTFFFK